MRTKQLPFTRLTLVALVVLSATARTAATQAPGLDLGGLLEVGGDGERYVRALEMAGLVPVTAWTIQPFSPSTAALLAPSGPNPWGQRLVKADSARFRILRPSASLVENTAYPVQVGIGPTWDGRGVTVQAQAGIAADWRFVHVQIAPLAFAAQNTAFPLAPNGQTGNLAYGDPRFPTEIDAPQRFGNSTYSRLMAGTSFLTFDAYGLAAGISTAPQRWGPALDFPLLIGPNAGGFPNVFFETSHPLNLWFARISGRLEYAQLGQSAYSPMDTGESQRLGSGVVVSGSLRWIPNLEVGLGRFLDRAWPGIPDLEVLERPFSGIFSPGPVVAIAALNDAYENENASAFARWVLPSAHAEFYGEFYKEDYPGEFHVSASSLVDKPDDYASYDVGFQRVLSESGNGMRVLHAELVNGEISQNSRDQRGFTNPLPPYIHNGELQGHTYDGMILGSPEAYGGEGFRIGVDDYTPDGRQSISFERALRFDWLPTAPSDSNVHPDVILEVRYEIERFRGKRDIELTVVPAIDLNRNLVANSNVANLTVAVTTHGWP